MKMQPLNLEKQGTAVPPLLLFYLFIVSLMTFVTGTGLVPGIANNIGPFEFLIALFILATLAYFLRQNFPVHSHFLINVLSLIVLVAGINMLKMAERPFFAVTQWLLLVYGLALLLVFYNWLIRYPELLRYLLRFLVFAAVVAALWVAIDGYLAGGDINASGPFRNRVHVGIYLGASFWITLIYLNYPGVSAKEKRIIYSIIPFILYGVAISGRRSVYLALIAGFLVLIVATLFLFDRKRNQLMPIILLGVGFITVLYLGRNLPWLPNVFFFQERVGTIEDRLRAFAGDDEVLADDENFILLQRQGMRAAVQDYPILGIGWGAFLDSDYSPTGHEMHSTPQKFLAELGLVGLTLYLIFTAYLLSGTLRIFRKARGTPYELSTFALMVALWSLHLSYAYNRSMTDRTFWLLVVIFLGFELVISGVPQSAKRYKPLSPVTPTSQELR
jgi:hypothetical protein